jgi:hypothetical protein
MIQQRPEEMPKEEGDPLPSGESVMNNRLSHLWHPEPVAPNPVALVPAGFAVCPIGWLAGAWQQQIYQAAYDRARALLVPPRTQQYRLNLEHWN